MGDLIVDIESHITELLGGSLPAGMAFHNLTHTRIMVSAVKELAAGLGLKERDEQILQIAAWFHDSGYCYAYHGHEAISMTLAGDYLRLQGKDEAMINEVNSCIRATRMPQSPLSTLQEMMCDADMRHLALPDYFDHAECLRQEWSSLLHKSFSDDEWNRQNMNFMTAHSYFTSYARTTGRRLNKITLTGCKTGCKTGMVMKIGNR